MRRSVVVNVMLGVLALGCWSEGMPLENTGEADGLCTAPDCSDTLSVDVTRRDEQIFPPGDYTFSIEIDAGSPLSAACSLSAEAVLSCSASNALHVRLNDNYNRFIVRVDDRAPEQLLMSVSFGDTEIGVDLLTPDYEYIGSNDPDCTLTCMQGTAAMRTAAPSS